MLANPRPVPRTSSLTSTRLALSGGGKPTRPCCREMFTNASHALSPTMNSTLKSQFAAALVSESSTSTSLSTDRVQITKLSAGLLSLFTGAGAVDMSSDRIIRALKGGSRPPPSPPSSPPSAPTPGALVDGRVPPPPLARGVGAGRWRDHPRQRRHVRRRVHAQLHRLRVRLHGAAARVHADVQVKTKACLGSPGFVYLVGCVTSGKRRREPTAPSARTCRARARRPAILRPPRDRLRVRPTCGSTAVEPYDDNLARARSTASTRRRRCDAGGGAALATVVRGRSVDEIEDFYLRGFVVDYASLIFSIMCTPPHGLAATPRRPSPNYGPNNQPPAPTSAPAPAPAPIRRRAPATPLTAAATAQVRDRPGVDVSDVHAGVGQRQGQRPTWDRMRDAIEQGTITTLTQGFNLISKIEQGGGRAQRARLGEGCCGWPTT